MKHLALLVTILSVALSTQAQTVRFGLTASPVFSFPYSLDASLENDGVKLGFSYGLLLDLAVDNNNRYAFHTGFLHTLTGVRVQQNITDTAGTVVQTLSQELKYQYVEIPLTMRLRTNEIGYITYWGQFGITPGILVANRYDQIGNPDPTGLLSFENERVPNAIPVNLALTIGGGIEYSLGGATSVLAGLMYQNGFTNIWNYDKADKDDRLSMRNITLRVGLLF